MNIRDLDSDEFVKTRRKNSKPDRNLEKNIRELESKLRKARKIRNNDEEVDELEYAISAIRGF